MQLSQWHSAQCSTLEVSFCCRKTVSKWCTNLKKINTKSVLNLDGIGQASEGQGGYYGSGGARASINETEHRPEMVALAADVENLTLVMEEIENLDAMLEDEKELNAGKGVTGKALEISSKIKKIMTSADVMDCLNRLEVEGEPVWGLSCDERDLVYAARQKVNEC